jgi:uncharacterized membrane protein YgcG
MASNTDKKRVPQAVIKNPRDGDGNVLSRVKSLHRKAQQREQRFGYISLKEFVRFTLSAASTGDSETVETLERWLHNKRCNAENPPQGIGRTRRKKSGNGGGSSGSGGSKSGFADGGASKSKGR